MTKCVLEIAHIFCGVFSPLVPFHLTPCVISTKGHKTRMEKSPLNAVIILKEISPLRYRSGRDDMWGVSGLLSVSFRAE